MAVQVFGTDISESAIEWARHGTYSEKIAENVSPERLQRFFSRVDSSFRIKQSIRDSCIFARHDLTSDAPFSQMDIVSCRNVFIYLSSSLQQRVLPALHYGLRPEGLLLLGSAETVGSRSDLFGAVNGENRIYMKKPVSAALTIEPRSPERTQQSAPNMTPARPAILMPTLLDLETRAARILRDLYAPAGVLVNSDMQVLHFHGQTDFYLEQVPGETGVNLLRLAREGLVHPLRKAVQTALSQRRPVHESGIQVEHINGTRQVRLGVIPLSDEALFCLVLFEDESQRDGTAAPDQKPSRAPNSAELQFTYAQRDLAQTRDYLRKMVEQHEATTEELRAANEEVRSANEELQSTNEELRTAKEQLQSSNEELTTVNDELKHRNSELNLASSDLSNILNATTIPIVMVGMDLRLRRFTPAAERLLRMVPADIGRTITEIHYPFNLPYLEEMLLDVLQTLGVQQHRVQDRDDRWYNLSVRPYRTVDDKIDGVVMTFIDIDDSTRALEQAERAREFSEEIVETVQHPLLVLDSDLRIIKATRPFYTAFDARPEDTLGQLIDDLGDGQWRGANLRRLLEQALLRDVPFRDLEITYNFPGIGTRTMRLNARRTPSIDANFRLLLAIEDITERREAAEIQYQRLFESAKDGIIVLESPSGMVVDVNPFFLELSRYSRAEVVGKPFWEIAPFLNVKEGRQLVSETIERGTSRYDSVALRTRDSRDVVVEIVANGYRVKERSLIQANIRDVTEKRRSEEEVRRSNLDLQQFAFAASHDLQEPLRTITSYLELLQQQYQDKLDPQANEHIRFIVNAADHMRQLVLDLLGFAQVARSEMNRTEISTEAALSSVLLNLQLAIESSQARISFDHLPMVFADGTQLAQLLQNLISNAIKYRGPAAPRIHLSAREAGPEWVFSVQDNGIGIVMRHAEHIFTVFKRLHGNKYPGTGVGLAICKRIVDRHNGRIWVESEPGAGSTFHFTLPKRNETKAGR